LGWGSAREEGSGSRSHGGRRESLRGEKARRVSVVDRASKPFDDTDSRREQASAAELDRVAFTGGTIG